MEAADPRPARPPGRARSELAPGRHGRGAARRRRGQGHAPHLRRAARHGQPLAAPTHLRAARVQHSDQARCRSPLRDPTCRLGRHRRDPVQQRLEGRRGGGVDRRSLRARGDRRPRLVRGADLDRLGTRRTCPSRCRPGRADGARRRLRVDRGHPARHPGRGPVPAAAPRMGCRGRGHAVRAAGRRPRLRRPVRRGAAVPEAGVGVRLRSAPQPPSLRAGRAATRARAESLGWRVDHVSRVDLLPSATRVPAILAAARSRAEGRTARSTPG